MSIVKFNKSRFPWINDRFPSLLDTDDFFADDFFTRDRNLPAINVKENEDHVEIELAVPGFNKKDFEVTVEDDVLHVCAKTSSEKKEEDEHYTRQEFSYSGFDRRMRLPEIVDQTKDVKAVYKNGVLKLDLKKKKEAPDKPKRVIEIS